MIERVLVDRGGLRGTVLALAISLVLFSCSDIAKTEVTFSTFEKNTYTATVSNPSVAPKKLLELLSTGNAKVLVLVTERPFFSSRNSWTSKVPLSFKTGSLSERAPKVTIVFEAPSDLPGTYSFVCTATVQSVNLEGVFEGESFNVQTTGDTTMLENRLSDAYAELGVSLARKAYDRKTLASRSLLLHDAKNNFPRFQQESNGKTVSLHGVIASIESSIDNQANIALDSGFLLKLPTWSAIDFNVGETVSAVGHLEQIVAETYLELGYIPVEDCVVWKS